PPRSAVSPTVHVSGQRSRGYLAGLGWSVGPRPPWRPPTDQPRGRPSALGPNWRGLSNRCPRNRSDAPEPASALLMQGSPLGSGREGPGAVCVKARTPSVTLPPTGAFACWAVTPAPLLAFLRMSMGGVRSTLRSRDSPSTPRAGPPAKRGPGHDP